MFWGGEKDFRNLHSKGFGPGTYFFRQLSAGSSPSRQKGRNQKDPEHRCGSVQHPRGRTSSRGVAGNSFPSGAHLTSQDVMSELACDWRAFLIRSPTRIHPLSEKQSPLAGKVLGRLAKGLSNSGRLEAPTGWQCYLREALVIYSLPRPRQEKEKFPWPWAGWVQVRNLRMGMSWFLSGCRTDTEETTHRSEVTGHGPQTCGLAASLLPGLQWQHVQRSRPDQDPLNAPEEHPVGIP